MSILPTINLNELSGISVVDTDPETGLEMYHYNECDNTSDPITQQCRGLVYAGQTLVCRSLPYTIELSDQTDVATLEALMPDLTQVTFFPAFEGTLLRMFAYPANPANSVRWFVSTHRRLDANRSRWGSNKTFGQMFDEALMTVPINGCPLGESVANRNEIRPTFAKFLDPANQYLFLLPSTSENHVVCNACDGQAIIHIGTFVSNTLRFDVDCGVQRSSAIQFNSHEALLTYVRATNPRALQGVLCFTSDGRQFKIVSSAYIALREIRGNEPSIMVRYLQVRNDETKAHALETLYPEHVPEFRRYDECLGLVATTIYEAYVNRFIRRQHTVVPREDFKVMKDAHTWFIAQKVSGANGKVTRTVITRLLMEQNPDDIDRIIRRLRRAESAAAPAVLENEERIKRMRLTEFPELR